MKIHFKIIALLAVAAFVFSCTKDDPTPDDVEPALCYIINYGDYSGAKSTITTYDKETGTVANNYYENVNGVPMISNVQHAVAYEGNIYMMGNSTDELSWVDAETFLQAENGVSDGIVKPRYGVGYGDYLYISCWGGDMWLDESTSYIAKFNITTKSVEETISLPGGPEGLAIANNKLYAALNYKDSVAVINLSSNAVSYIETPAVTSYFVKDNSDNLYVSLVSTYSDYSATTGLGYINTDTDAMDATYTQDGISTSYVNILAPNDDFSKLYVMTSAYDASWNLSGAVAVFDVASKSFEASNLVENISGMNGLAWYNDQLFTFIAESVTSDGTAITFDADGTEVEEFSTGKAPFMLLTVEE